MKKLRSWRLLAPGELAAIQAGLAPLVLGWQQSCLPAGAALPSTVQSAVENLSAGVECRQSLLDESGQVCAQLCCAQAALDVLQERSGLGARDCTQPPGLARAATVHLLRDLLARLARLPTGSAAREALFSQRQEALFLPHASGAVSLGVDLGAGAGVLQIVLTQALVAGWCQPLPARRGGLVARQGLADRLTLPYRVLAGSAELALADLMQLEPGDVLRFDRRAEQGLLLASEAGEAWCRAGMGLHQGTPVLQVCGD